MTSCPACGRAVAPTATICTFCERDLRPPPPAPPITRVAVVDVALPFGSMVIVLLKWALAAIPALLILGAIGLVLAQLAAALLLR